MKKMIFYSILCMFTFLGCSNDEQEDFGREGSGKEDPGKLWYVWTEFEECNADPFDFIDGLKLDVKHTVSLYTRYSCTSEAWNSYNMRRETTFMAKEDFIGVAIPLSKDHIGVGFLNLHIKDYRSEWRKMVDKYSLTYEGHLCDLNLSNMSEAEAKYWAEKLVKNCYIKSAQACPEPRFTQDYY